MRTFASAGMRALAFTLLAGSHAWAQDIATDVNIVTGLDVSYSIDTETVTLELEGIAKALRDPRVIRAIGTGRHGRIGFAVFAWHFNAFPVIVGWTVIASPEDAGSAARALDAHRPAELLPKAVAPIPWQLGGFTDLSEALGHAEELLRTAPFAADRAIINIVGNGRDNVAEDAGMVRDRIVAHGGTINGLVLGDDPGLVQYYREQVIGGRAPFVMSTGDTASIADAFARKFIGDIVASTGSTGP